MARPRLHNSSPTATYSRFTGGRSNGAVLLDKAQRTLDTARAIAMADPDSTYTLAYDAARRAGTALLAQQGLRPTSRGGHHAVERALRAQFGQGFRAFGTMRRRRNELEYPDLPDETASTDEAQRAIDEAQTMIDAANKLLPRLGLF